MDLEKLKQYAPAVTRIGLALVFLYFSISQLTAPDNWVDLVPETVTGIMPASTVILLNGVFELVFGIMLLLGVFTRTTALLLGLHLAGITFSLGFTSIAARDFGLTLATLSIAMYGPDVWCIMKNTKF